MNKKTIALALIFLFLLSIITTKEISLAGIDTWTTNGPYGLRLSRLIIDPTNPNTIYAFSYDCINQGVTSVVFKSTDGGVTWNASGSGIPLTDCGNPRWSPMVMDPGAASTLYAANEQGLYKTINGGQTWSQVTDMRVQSVAISPHGTLYIGVFDDRGYQGGIYRSYNGGSSWQLSCTGCPSPTNTASNIVVAPSAQHIIYAAFQGAGLYKSFNGGDTWQSINSGFLIMPYVYTLTVDPYDSQVVYFSAASGVGLFRTNNGGESWQAIGTGLPTEIYAFDIDPGNQQVIYAGTTSGVYRSTDNLGANWQPFSEGMGSRIVFSFALDHNDPQNLYAGTTAGVWKRTLVNIEPEDYSISINNGALYTNQDTVTLHFSAPAGTGEMIVSNDGGFGGAYWQSYNTSMPWTLATYGNYVLPRTVYTKFKTGGTITGLYQDDIVYDPNPPTGSVTITNTLAVRTDFIPHVTNSITATYTQTQYLPAIMLNYRQGYNLVRLLLTATDDLSGVDGVLISDASDFSGAQWETLVSPRDFWLPVNGSGTVYVKFRDRAGNHSVVYSTTVP